MFSHQTSWNCLSISVASELCFNVTVLYGPSGSVTKMNIGQHINLKFLAKLKIAFSVQSRNEEAGSALEDTSFTKN
jgi:hypothetical protein